MNLDNEIKRAAKKAWRGVRKHRKEIEEGWLAELEADHIESEAEYLCSIFPYKDSGLKFYLYGNILERIKHEYEWLESESTSPNWHME